MQSLDSPRQLGLPLLAAMLLATGSWSVSATAAAADDKPAGVLFTESFDDGKLLTRGWYDGERFKIDGDGARAGAGCIAFHWNENKKPEFSGSRHLFEPSETIFIRCYLKLSKGWGWTGKPFHPHCINVMTTDNEKFHGPAASRLTLYVEPWNGRLRLGCQDIQNAKAPHGLTQGPLRGGYNGKLYDSKDEVFKDDQWYCIEAMFQLNTLDLAADKPNADGIIRGWVDDKLVIDETKVIFRTTDYPKMKFNQFLMTPYFGDGLLPHAQTLWIDELAVSTKRVGLLEKSAAPTGGNGAARESQPKTKGLVRIAAAQTKNRMFDYKLKPSEALAEVDRNLDAIEKVVVKAGEAGCDAVALPEDTLGLLKWEAGNMEHLQEVLPTAVARMLDRLGRAAAKYKMYLIVCNDTIDPKGTIHNTSFFLGRDGKEIGRYHKVNLPFAEQSRTPGNGFPVFETPDLGAVGMLICYDLVFPETTRCLALNGADVVFVSTMGGAAMGDEEISLAAFRTRAVDNFLWLVIAKRSGGTMIISPKGKVVADTKEGDGLAIADIDPFGGRDGGDAFNKQPDLRGRLFRERIPAAYGVLVDSHPPALDKVKSNVTKEEAIRTMAIGITTGEERFNQAQSLLRAGKKEEAIRLFEQLCKDCPTSWIDLASRAQLKNLRPQTEKPAAEKTPADKPAPSAPPCDAPENAPCAGNAPESGGLAAKYPGDAGIDKDPRVVYVENFESNSLEELKSRWETVGSLKRMSFSDDVAPGSGGKQSLLTSHVGGDGEGPQLYRRLKPGYDKLYARYNVKFDPDCAPISHFGTALGGNNPSTSWPMVSAGNRPKGDKTFWVGIEPFGKSWVWDYYAYWGEMRGSPPRGQTWGNSFVHDPQLKVERGKWICIELMIKMNDVGETNGEMALWVDGKPINHLGKGFPKGKWVFDKFIAGQGGDSPRWNDATKNRESITVPEGGEPFEGFRWRTAKELNLNYVWLYAYITGAPAGHVSKVWFDDVVVATEYIGPIAAKTP